MRRRLKTLLAIAAVTVVFVVAACTTQTDRVAPPVASRTVTPLRAGTFIEEVRGFKPGFTVEVVLSANRIENIRVISHNDTDIIVQSVIDSVIPTIISQQSTSVDVVVGATMTSLAISQAVQNAIAAAGGNPADYWTPVSTPQILSRTALTDPFGTPRGPEQTPRRWDESHDIVIVGGGHAGLMAAYAAASNGAQVLLVEKMPFLGGNSLITGGQMAFHDSRIAAEAYTRLNLPPDTAEQHIRDTIVGGDFQSFLPLVENFVHAGPFILNLLLDNGLRVREHITMPGGHYGFRVYGTQSGQGDDVVEVQMRMINRPEIDVRLNTKMVRIYREGNQSGRAVGIAVYTSGGVRTIRAERALILATGGFGANVAMRLQQLPFLGMDIPTTNHVGATGEGILFAQEVGVQTTQMNNIQLYPFADPNTGILDLWAVIPFSGPSAGIVYVDHEGRRFVNEGDRRDVVTRAMQDSGGFPTFSIFGQDFVDGVGFVNQDEIDAGIEIGRVLAADTLEELAREINRQTFRGENLSIDPAVLAATIQRHNNLVRGGNDLDFGKVITPAAIVFERGPFYAIPQWPSVHHTMGGLTVTPQLEAVDIWGEVIPNLFAVGEIVGGVHGTNRLGANAKPEIMANGYIVGYFTSTGRMPSFIQAFRQ